MPALWSPDPEGLDDGVPPLRALPALAAVLTVAVLAPGASAEVVPVDPGAKLSAGKQIVGSGQNLPSMQAEGVYLVGPGPIAQVEAYYSSGAAARDQRQVAGAALRWTKRWLLETCGGTTPSTVRACKAAAVFDMDDTLVSWFPILSSNDPALSIDSSRSNEAMATCAAPVIDGTRRLYRSLLALGVTPIIITGRESSHREETERCLDSLGMSEWQSVIMREPGDARSAASFKSQARKALERKGWRIGPSVGDQISDMAFGHLGHGFLIPNPMYFIP